MGTFVSDGAAHGGGHGGGRTGRGLEQPPAGHSPSSQGSAFPSTTFSQKSRGARQPQLPPNPELFPGLSRTCRRPREVGTQGRQGRDGTPTPALGSLGFGSTLGMSFEPNGWVWRCPESPSAMVRGEQLDLSPTSGDSGSPALPLPKHLWIVPRAAFCLFYCAF